MRCAVRHALHRTFVTETRMRRYVAQWLCVSYDTPTLARDIRALLDTGYTLGPLTAFDLFPTTAHVETVLVLKA